MLGQLQELERLADENCRDGDLHLVETLVWAVLRVLKVLPKEIAHRIHTNFYVGDSHVHKTDVGRVALWARLSKGLAEDLDRLSADESLVNIDVSKRPKTKGEAILAVCERLEAARDRGEDMLALARALEREGAGTDAAFDGSELVRLLSKKRVLDYGKYEADILRRIYHARIVGGMFYNQLAN